MDEKVRNARRLRAKVVMKGLESRNMRAYYAETGKEALEKALELIPAGSSVGYGGVNTADQIGLKDALESGGRRLIRRELAKTIEEEHGFYSEIFNADFFLTSANAMTEDGIIVNIDGRANRVSAIAYGPAHVLFIVGMNKITKDLDSAISRARNEAAPINAQKFDINTPCKKFGTCMNCKSPDTICCQMLITRFSKYADRIHVILVNEDLGY